MTWAGMLSKGFLTIIPVLSGNSIIVSSFIHLPTDDPAVTMLGERAIPGCVKDVCLQHGQTPRAHSKCSPDPHAD